MYRFLEHLTQPLTLLYLLTALAVVWLWFRRRETRGRLLLVTVPVAGWLVLSLPPISYLLLGSLEWQYPPGEDRVPEGAAIVVLNSGFRFSNPARPRAELEWDTMLRCVHALELYHRSGPRPILVTGGPEYAGGPGPTMADIMRDFLVETGVKDSDIVLEQTSRSTYENAVECRKMLAERGMSRAVLVTASFHMPRALRCFRKQGIDTIPSVCDYRTDRLLFRPDVLLPNPAAAQDSRQALHEWMGLLWYRLQGRT